MQPKSAFFPSSSNPQRVGDALASKRNQGHYTRKREAAGRSGITIYGKLFLER